MGIRKRGQNWHYRVKVNGHDYSGDTGLAATERNRTAAMRKEAEARQKILAGRSSELKLEIKSFSEAAGLFMDWYRGEHREHPASAKRVQTSFVSAGLFFKGSAVSQINAGAIEQYKTYRRNMNIKEVTLRHDLHALSSFFQYAIKHNWTTVNPVTGVKMPSGEAERVHVLTDQEEFLYFETIKAMAAGAHIKPGRGANGQKAIAAERYRALHDFAKIVLLQGARPEDVMGARVQDIHGDDWHILHGKSKSAKRVLHLLAETRAIFEGRIMAAPPSGWLFPGKVSGHVKTFQRSHDEVLKRSGLSFVMYDLRHTWATRAAARGVPLATIAAILGHADLRTLRRYVHPGQADIKAGMKMLETIKEEKRVEKTDGRFM